MSETNGSRDERMDRLERWFEMLATDHEQFRQDLKDLLAAQVLVKDTTDKHGEQIAETSRQIAQMRQHGTEVNERIDKLVSGIGELVRSLPRQVGGK